MLTLIKFGKVNAENHIRLTDESKSGTRLTVKDMLLNQLLRPGMALTSFLKEIL